MVERALAPRAGGVTSGMRGILPGDAVMTRNRERKARIRARQRATGDTFTQAARHIGHHRRPIQDLLEDAAVGLRAADTTDTAAVLQAAWTALCTIGAAGQMLSICADPDHYPACWLLTEPFT
jgi:hypothetical protein